MGVKIGNKNKIKNSTIIGGSQINVSSQNEKSSKKSFWKSVWQGVASNLIWWIIGIIAIIVVGVFATLSWDLIIEFITGG